MYTTAATNMQCPVFSQAREALDYYARVYMCIIVHAALHVVNAPSFFVLVDR